MAKYIETNFTLVYKYSDDNDLDMSKINVERVQESLNEVRAIEWDDGDVIRVNTVEYRSDNS